MSNATRIIQRTSLDRGKRRRSAMLGRRDARAAAILRAEHAPKIEPIAPSPHLGARRKAS